MSVNVTWSTVTNADNGLDRMQGKHGDKPIQWNTGMDSVDITSHTDFCI